MASFFFLTVSALLVVTTEGDHIRGGYLAWWPVDDAGTVSYVNKFFRFIPWTIYQTVLYDSFGTSMVR